MMINSLKSGYYPADLVDNTH